MVPRPPSPRRAAPRPAGGGGKVKGEQAEQPSGARPSSRSSQGAPAVVVCRSELFRALPGRGRGKLRVTWQGERSVVWGRTGGVSAGAAALPLPLFLRLHGSPADDLMPAHSPARAATAVLAASFLRSAALGEAARAPAPPPSPSPSGSTDRPLRVSTMPGCDSSSRRLGGKSASWLGADRQPRRALRLRFQGSVPLLGVQVGRARRLSTEMYATNF